MIRTEEEIQVIFQNETVCQKIRKIYMVTQPNKWLYKEETLVNDFLHGSNRIWDFHGNLESEHMYENGVRNGPFIFWYSNKKLKLLGYAKNGLMEGPIVTYYPNGNLRMKGFMRRGHFEGIKETYYENNLIDNRLVYQNGELDGLCIFWDTQGKIIAQYDYYKGRRRPLLERECKKIKQIEASYIMK